MLRLALTKLVEIVGEAAKQVTEATQTMASQVPWSARMRDRLVHHDLDISVDVLLSTVTVDLPSLLGVVPRPD